MSRTTLIMSMVASLILISGCNRNKSSKEDANMLEFSLQNDDQSSFVDSLEVKFIQLEETDDALFKYVGQIQQCGDRLLVSDDGNYKLHVYDMNGKYVGQIGSRGQAGGEYVKLTSFFIEKDSNKVCLWDDESRKLLTYSLADYSFISERNLPEISSKCCVPADSCLIWYNDAYEGDYSDNYFIVTDKKGVVQNSFVKKEFKSGYITGSSYPLFTIDGKVKGYTPYNMVLYSMNEEGVTGKLNISVKDFSMPDLEFLNKISNNGQTVSLFKALSDSEYISYYDFLETDNLIGLTVMRQHEKYFGVADRYSGATYFNKMDDFTGRLQIGKILYFVPNSINGGLLAVVDKEEIKESNLNNIRPELQEMINNNNNNPIIAIIRRN